MDWSITLPPNSYIHKLISSHTDNIEELCNSAKLVPKLTSELDSTFIYYRGVVLQNLSFEFYKNEEGEAYQTRYPFYLTMPVCLTQFSYNYKFKNSDYQFTQTDTAIPHCIAMFYVNPNDKNSILINDTVHVAGVCQYQKTQLPIIHIFAYKIANYNIMPSLCFLKSDYQSLVNFVSSELGDDLLAEYVILLLGMPQKGDSKPLSLLITRKDMACDERLIKTLQYLVEYVKYIDSYTEPMHSTMDYEQTPEILVPGQLQLGNGTALVINLDNIPVESMDSIDNLLNGKVDYHFGPSLYQIRTKLRTILTTNNEDTNQLPPASLYIKYKCEQNTSPKITVPSDYKYIQLIDKAWTSPFRVDIPNEVEQLMIDSWIQNREVANIDDFNTWVSLSRTLCYLHGDDIVTDQHWNHILALECNRRERISLKSV